MLNKALQILNNMYEDEEWCKKPVHCLWQQKTFLQEAKHKYKKKRGK